MFSRTQNKQKGPGDRKMTKTETPRTGQYHHQKREQKPDRFLLKELHTLPRTQQKNKSDE